jgi:hypothetical protein
MAYGHDTSLVVVGRDLAATLVGLELYRYRIDVDLDSHDSVMLDLEPTVRQLVLMDT